MLARSDAPAGDRSHRDRDRLDERGERSVLVADWEHLAGGKDQLLLERAVHEHSDETDADARVATPDTAGVAVTAGGHRPDGDAHADLDVRAAVRADLLDDRGRLVPLDPRVESARVLTEEVVEVRPAQPHRLGSDEHLAGARSSRGRDVQHLHLPDGSSDRCAHVELSHRIESRGGTAAQRGASRL